MGNERRTNMTRDKLLQIKFLYGKAIPYTQIGEIVGYSVYMVKQAVSGNFDYLLEGYVERKGKHTTPEEACEMKELIEKGLTTSEISKRTGRSVDVVNECKRGKYDYLIEKNVLEEESKVSCSKEVKELLKEVRELLDEIEMRCNR